MSIQPTKSLIPFKVIFVCILLAASFITMFAVPSIRHSIRPGYI